MRVTRTRVGDGDERTASNPSPSAKTVMPRPKCVPSIAKPLLVALAALALASAAVLVSPSLVSTPTVAATTAFGPAIISSSSSELRRRPAEHRSAPPPAFTSTSSSLGVINTDTGRGVTTFPSSLPFLVAPHPRLRGVRGEITPRRRSWSGCLGRCPPRGGDPSGVICSVRGGTSADAQGDGGRDDGDDEVIDDSDNGSSGDGNPFEEYGDVPVIPDVDLPRKMMSPPPPMREEFNPNLGPTLGPDPEDATNLNSNERKTRTPEDDGFFVPEHAIVLMDCFSPYAGLYLSQMARDAYGVAVINVLSNYVAGYLLSRIDVEEGMDANEGGGGEGGAGEAGDDRGEGLTAAMMAEDRDERRKQVLSSRVPPRGTEKRWSSRVPFDIVAVYCESDSGLDDAERLGDALGLTSRGRSDGVNPARRDKFLMNEVVKGAGLNTVKQKFCKSVEEALEFATEELGMSKDDGEDDDDSTRNLRRCVVVKPPRGSGSDQVHLCRTPTQIAEAFDIISSSPVFGATSSSKYDGALLQEFAGPGVEYAVDVVSKDGVHKVIALWRYDKRPVNGAPFVYHATELVDVEDPDGVGAAVCDYVRRALDALEVGWGLTHTEVVVLDDDDDGGDGESAERGAAERCRLIEVNRRQHNTDFAPLATACVGYNALDALLAAYLGDFTDETDNLPQEAEEMRLDWDSVPAAPPPLRARGAVVHLVCHVNGTLRSDSDGGPVNVTAMDEVCRMESFRHMEVYPRFQTPGMNVIPTVDIKTDAGWVHLINDDPRRFREDYDRIVELMPTMFLVVDEDDDDG